MKHTKLLSLEYSFAFGVRLSVCMHIAYIAYVLYIHEWMYEWVNEEGNFLVIWLAPAALSSDDVNVVVVTATAVVVVFFLSSQHTYRLIAIHNTQADKKRTRHSDIFFWFVYNTFVVMYHSCKSVCNFIFGGHTHSASKISGDFVKKGTQ